jgi:hypothetical protein
MLELLTTANSVVKISNIKAKLLMRQRVIVSDRAFAEMVIWDLPEPLQASQHSFKYRLAFVVNGECVLRYDNEAGKGDHRHLAGRERAYKFVSPRQLASDFFADIERYRHEHPDD